MKPDPVTVSVHTSLVIETPESPCQNNVLSAPSVRFLLGSQIAVKDAFLE